MAGNAFLKDPHDKLDYAINWAGWLGADTIATSTWTVPAGITRVSDSTTTTVATIWLSGGTANSNYTCTNHIVTAAGREKDQSLVFMVREN